MMSADLRTVRLDIASSIDMIEMVQTVLTHLSGVVGLNEDATHYLSVAVRESVVNAIKHGNKNDPAKRVIVEFSHPAADTPDELAIYIEDQGEGFVPEEVADPLAPENILKSSGRGIFLIRNFMDDVQLAKVPGGGMSIRMVKKAPKAAQA
jgi:serine/threonine-protein kinase RsbW